ncbi:hypothetical protein SAY87_015962 [Trapa incisa]|uniref:Uncharacterized protein n=1 Tax=Trapa incisa TaxID=236973 RepID=A0AAN7LG11_9MYRT|nr:hypothetical protein SAY87_015962 [Trapa incisa]
MRKPCCEKQDMNKGAWSKQEDQMLIDYIRKHGEGCWRTLPQAAGLLRCGKSCRLRWINYLRPDVKRGNFAEDEEDLIIKLHALLGNRWSLIAGRLPGRTDNEVKNYWNSHLRRKLLKMGIDPSNHRPNHSVNPPPTAQITRNVSSEATSSSLKERAPSAAIPQIDQDSNKERGDERDVPKEVPDLNLELTMSFQSPSQARAEGEPEPTVHHTAGGSQGAPYPTLLLFR